MKQNYYLLFEKQIEEITNKNVIPKLLLHSCCGPCSSQVITCLTKYFDITILYYNPNISPVEEYEKRKEEQIRLINSIDHINKLDIIDCDYDNDLYENVIKGLENEVEGGRRCSKCFYLRLEKTVDLAKKNNYDFFSTTLSISPHKNSYVINSIGESLEKEYNIKWLYSDFKKKEGYKKSIELSKKYDLYRQDYCGCIYSKREKENNVSIT